MLYKALISFLTEKKHFIHIIKVQGPDSRTINGRYYLDIILMKIMKIAIIVEVVLLDKIGNLGQNVSCMQF